MDNSESKLCPSSVCVEGALLLGIVQGHQQVALLNTPLYVDENFINKVSEFGSPEKRFRFANKCIKSGCKQWTGESCGVIQSILEANKQIDYDENLKPCIIRDRCRWFNQEGQRACSVCTHVVTNNMDEEPAENPLSGILSLR